MREGHRIAARAFGQRAERRAAEWLEAQGYRILARKFTIRGGEIDIIAQAGDVIAFVEVKARGSVEAALGAITPAKQRRLARAAAAWVTRNPFAADGYTLRGDALALDETGAPLHIENAFALEFED
ncbi:MAG: YraN family protein [Pseudomonadota bacterium]|nr:YraN family protein [Pseudomonadota bacterium]